MTVPATEVNPWEELNRLRKAARLALAFQAYMNSDPATVARLARDAHADIWATLAKQGFLTRPSEATIALAVELLASAARHPSARTS